MCLCLLSDCVTRFGVHACMCVPLSLSVKCYVVGSVLLVPVVATDGYTTWTSVDAFRR